MSENFGLKIGIEGEKEFKKSLAEINNSFKAFGSEMKPVDSQFDKNDKSTEALTARSEVLNKEIDSQKQKIETHRSALTNAAESFSKNNRRTKPADTSEELPLLSSLLPRQAHVPLRNWLSFFLPAPGVGLTFCKTQAFGNCCSCKIRRWNRISYSFSLICCPFFSSECLTIEKKRV